MTERLVAVDLGATSGRVISGILRDGELHHETVRRFSNGPVRTDEGLFWDVGQLFEEILSGLEVIRHSSDEVVSVGVDSWAVDYGLISQGELMHQPHHYRDERTSRGVEVIHRAMPYSKLFQENGLQFLPFNSIYQLATERWAEIGDLVESILLIPDLVNFWLTGERSTELTNASTTGLIPPGSDDWNDHLIQLTGAPRHIFTPIGLPGSQVGSFSKPISDRVGFSAPVFHVASHDTASAVLAVPMPDRDCAYISCGTWGLVGLELDQPILSERAMEENFTNERGVDGTIRFLHNVMGLWLLNESVEFWKAEGKSISLTGLIEAAKDYRGHRPIFDVNDPVFMAPGDIPQRITTWLAERELPMPEGHAGIVATIIDSLAHAFANALRTSQELSGVQIRQVHIVGGGSQNPLLCQRIADFAGLPVFAGPVEATAMGNLLVQARALGLASDDIWGLRSIVRLTHDPQKYLPRTNEK